MEPKNSTNLDPKLKEIYDRVMGMQVPSPASPQPTTQSTPAAVAPQEPAHSNAVQPPKVASFVSKPNGGDKKSFPLGIVIALVGIIFFVVYAFFWIRFFNIPLPFKLPF